MKAKLENVGKQEQSLAYRVFKWTAFPFNWHFHPEIELTLIRSGYGQRFVGDNIQPFSPGDVVLLGRDLPHTWMSSDELPRRPAACQSVVVQFHEDFLGKEFFHGPPETARIAALFRRAAGGLRFTGPTRSSIADSLIAMAGYSPLHRLTMLLECLDTLAKVPAHHARPLSSAGFHPEIAGFRHSGITTVLAYLNREYTHPLRLETLANMTHLSPGAFSRFFQRSTGKSFTQYVTELRIGRACELMINTDQKISTIAFDAGFNNLSNFNRQFQKTKSCTPRVFRDSHWQHR